MSTKKDLNGTTLSDAIEKGLTSEEYDTIIQLLGRVPNEIELHIYATLWSERCSFKNAYHWLKTLPYHGENLLIKSGAKNVGLINLGGGLECAFKMKAFDKGDEIATTELDYSIAAAGATPLAESLCLRLDQESMVLQNVDKSGSIDLFFDSSFTDHEVTNGLSAGALRIENFIPSTASSNKNSVFLLEVPMNEIENNIVFAILSDLNQSNAIDAVQSVGVSGIIHSIAKMCFEDKVGVTLSLDKLEKELSLEDQLSMEVPGRFIIAFKEDKKIQALQLLRENNINYSPIGEITTDNTLTLFAHEKVIASIPKTTLLFDEGAPQYKKEFQEPAYYQENKNFDIQSIEEPSNIIEVATKLLKLPNIKAKRANLQPNDANVIAIPNTEASFLTSTKCNSRYVYAEPEVGTQIAVAEAARSIVASGGEPVAISNCLNFGNPDNPEHYWQFVESVRGMGSACEIFKTPVTGGDVMFDPSIKGNNLPFLPTPAIGMVGKFKNPSFKTALAFESKGDLIYIIGESKDDISSSEYLWNFFGIKNSPAPYFSLEQEVKVQETVKTLISDNLINAAHGVSLGGLYATLVEMASINSLGFDIETDLDYRPDAFLFGESQSRVAVGVSQSQEDEFIEYMGSQQTQFTLLGHVTQGKLMVDGEHFGFIDKV